MAERSGWATPHISQSDKQDVKYRTAEKCSMCDYYLNGKCSKVKGGISPEATCDLWTMRGLPKGIDGEFYQEEYSKSKDGVVKGIKNLVDKL